MFDKGNMMKVVKHANNGLKLLQNDYLRKT